MSLFLHFINKDKPLRPAAQDPIKQNREKIYSIINDPKLKKTPQGKISILVTKLLNCSFVGEACTNNPKDGNKNFDKSIFGLLTKLIATPFMHPPASGTLWLYSSLQNTGFIPKSYAATGIGFGSIQPLSGVWTALRDIAYLLLVLVIITIGFMIMFRMKLNPQTVISLENSLPKIVIALIIITFSFPLAGFLIDLMYIVIAIVVSTLGPAAGYTAADINSKQQFFMAAGPAQLFEGINAGHWGVWAVLWDLPNALLNLIPFIGEGIKYIGAFIGLLFVGPWILQHILLPVFSFLSSISPKDLSIVFANWDLKNFVEKTFDLLSTPVGLIIGVILGGLVIIPLLIGILILFTVIFIFFRLFFLLFSSYIKLLLFIAISPILLLMEAVPGQSAFTNWLKNIVSQLIVFPTIIALIIFSVILMRNAAPSGSDPSNLLQPPFLFGIDPSSFGLILGFFFLFMIPDIVKVVQQTLVPKPGPLDQGAGIGVFFGGTKAGFEGGLGEISKYAGLGYYISPIGELMKKVTGGIVDPTKSLRGPGH